MTKKLWRVTLRGMKSSIMDDQTWGVSYAVAETAHEAGEKVKTSLTSRDIGFPRDREVEKIELLAENVNYPDCRTVLYM